jgi:hypothetical protein
MWQNEPNRINRSNFNAVQRAGNKSRARPVLTADPIAPRRAYRPRP